MGQAPGAFAGKYRTAAISRVAEQRSTLKVRAGDTLWSISQKLGVELDDLCRWNGIRDPRSRKLQIGEPLVVYTSR